MNKLNYQAQEYACAQSFVSLGRVYHFYSAENFATFLRSDEDFGMAMNVFALACAYWRSQVRVLTFQLMSNHFHIIACGQREEIGEMVRLFVKLLQRKLEAEERMENLEALEISSLPVDSLDYARKCIAYVNRNGFVVSHDWSPMTYPWGSNRFYFDKERKEMHTAEGKELKLYEKREIARSRRFDEIKGLLLVNGAISPISYCDIESGEKLFRDARHYFDTVTRDIEGQGDVASRIGGTQFLTDNELYSITMRIIKKEFNATDISSLDARSRITIAKSLRYNYSASYKQICRMLRLTEEAVQAIFREKID